MLEYKMSLSDLKKQLKDLRPKFGNTEDDLKKELDYHMRAKKAIENKERMDKVRAAKKSGTAPATAPASAPIQKEKKEKTPKEKAPEEKISAKKAALMAQLAALGSD
jgi:hypothetical protein